MTTMSPSIKSSDPECQKESLKRCRFMDCCLVISLVLIILAMGSFCTFYFIWGRQLPGEDPIDLKKSQAHLVLKDVVVRNATLKWDSNRVGNVYIGQHFTLSKDYTQLIVEKTGLYYVYSNLALSFHGSSDFLKDGLVSLNVLKKNGDGGKPIITHNLQMDKTVNSPHSSFSGTVQLLFAGERLSAELSVLGQHEYWQLEEKDTNFLGLFLVSDSESIPNIH